MSLSYPSSTMTPLPTQVEKAVDVIRRSGVVAIPTDTVYGLAASPFDQVAVQRIYEIKHRPTNLAMPLLLANLSDLPDYASKVPDSAWDLASKFWPGALTLVLPKADRIPASVSGGKQTIALRVPNAWLPRAVATELQSPITGTSANISGSPPATTASEVARVFGSSITIIKYDEPSQNRQVSTVLDLSNEIPCILRQGAISKAQIETICGPVSIPHNGT
ncbi:MAG: L-threonylcarbamoyladenylate synthase [SAR202 cluster bacterium]|nr:L-threonylcarbamoyladenylate synthase [SAR202 cluster bacterium]